MEERCRLLRDKLHAIYYENPRTYLGFAALCLRKIEGNIKQEMEVHVGAMSGLPENVRVDECR